MSDRTFDRAVTDWLESGSDRTPPAAIDAVLLAVKTTPQERDLRNPRRFTQMPTYLRLAAAIAIVAIVGAGAVLYINRAPDIGTPTPPPSPTIEPSASPSADQGLDTSAWIAYTSERYGFDIKRPPLWAETPADTYWDRADADVFPAPGTEDFYYPGISADLGVRVSAWSFIVEPGTTLDTLIEAYCVESGGTTCPTIMDSASPAINLDGDEGVSVAGPNLDSQVFVLVDDRVYIVSAWRPENDPSVAPFGGGRRLVEAYASTMTLRPAGPAPDAPVPALTGAFTSERYGYSLDFPGAFWTATPAADLWLPGSAAEGWEDTIRPASEVNGFRAASAIVPESVVLDDWISQNVTFTTSIECGPARSTLGEILIDGQPAKIRTSCEELEATLVVDGRLYLFTLFLDSGEPYSTAGGRGLFEAMMATVQLTPETAEVAPTAAPS